MNKFLTLATLLCTVLLWSGPSHSQIYRTTDEQGNVVFTDTPPADSGEREEIQLNQTNTAPPPPDLPRAEPAPEPEEEEAVEISVAITAPAYDTTIPMGPGNFSISAGVNPSLADGQALQLYMDGIPWGDPQSATSWSLTNVFRGKHDFTVAVVDAEGKHLAGSAPVRINVMRPSVNFRNRN